MIQADPSAPSAVGGADARGMVSARCTSFAPACMLWGAIAAALLFSGCVLRIALLRAHGLLPGPVYQLILSIHAGSTFSYANASQLALLAVVAPCDAREGSGRRLLFLGTVWLVAVQVPVVAALYLLEAPPWAFLVNVQVPSVVLAGSLAWAASHWRRFGYATSVVLGALALVALVGLPSYELLFLFCAVALRLDHARGAEVVAERGAERHISTSVLIVVNTLLAFRVLRFLESLELLSFVRFGASAWLIVRLWNGAPLARSCALLAARGGLALMASELLLQLVLEVLIVDPRIYDTLYVVGVHHAAALATFLLLLAVGLRELRPAANAPPAAVRWLRRGIGIGALGSLGFVLCLAALGARGMLRRYVTYLPRFGSLQVAASVSALLLVAGVVFLGLGLLRLRRRARRAAST